MFDNKFNAFHYDVYCGIDTSKKSNAVTFVDRESRIKSLKMSSESNALICYTQKHFPEKKMAFVYEAGPTGYGLYDDLTSAGYFCMVAAPSMIPKAPGERVKTNRLDSRSLAEKLRGGQLKGIHVPTGNYRRLRALAQLRKKTVGQQRATKLQIKSLFLLEGLSFPVNADGKTSWSKQTIEQIKSFECDGAIRFKLDQYLSQLEFWHGQLLKVQKELRRFCYQDAELRKSVELIMSLRGLGPTISIYLLSRIGDWRNIRNGRQLAAFFGLVPSENSTGERVNRGPITRMGDRLGRAMLIEAAWVAIKFDPELREYYDRIFTANNRDKDASRLAIVAVARKIAVRIYAVLKRQKPYEIRSAAPELKVEISASGGRPVQSAGSGDSPDRSVAEKRDRLKHLHQSMR